ncbi:MAG TPA: hypothetical protein VLW65_12670 [Bryobacteraceae bacterium]|nr:hypothetical protein [Bryobacteraceae bacterium]
MTFRWYIPSNQVMRQATALLMTLLLVTIVAACSLMGCAFAADSSTSGHACCHKHSSGMPCAPKTKMQQCAYNLLEQSKASSMQISVAAPAPATTAPEPVAAASASPRRPQRLADSMGLHLRIRVLLI